MKALIISEDEKVYNKLNDTLTAAGYDTIIYKWLLKALDNIEEIRPDCIVVSSSEYPRHWKTLVQFVKSGIGGENVDVYLYEPNPMSSEDEEKAKILGITDYFTSLEDDVLKGIFGIKEEVIPEPVTVTEPVEVPESEPVPAPLQIDEETKPEEPVTQLNNTGHFMFTHPDKKNFVSGKYFDYNGKTLSCTLQNAQELIGLKQGVTIEYFSFFDSKTTKSACVKVCDTVNVSTDNTFVIVEISKIYEEN